MAVNEKSIAEIERQIERLGASKTTKKNEAEIKRLKTVLNRVYLEYKQKVMNYEEKNYNSLVFLRSTHGFYKLLGHSLLFFAFGVAPKIGASAKIYADGDYELKSNMGVISIHGLGKIEKKLKLMEAEKVVLRDKTGNIVVYKLPWTYTTKEVEDFVGQNTYKMDKYNHVIIAENIVPVLFMQLNNLLKACYENVRRLDPVARETLGNFVVERVAEMLRIYMEMANGRMNELDGYKHIRLRLNKVKSQVKILVDLRLWNGRVYARVGETLIETQRIVDIQMVSIGEQDGAKV